MTRALSSTPGLLRVFLASIVGRLPMGALSLVLILRTRDMTGSYAAGGIAAAACALGHAVGSPLLGRIVDRRGQTRVLAGAACLHALALLGFAALPDGSGLEPAVALAFVAGAAHPPLTACQRAIWGDRLTDPDARHKLYSFEAAVFEIVYICGPLLVVSGLGAWSLQVAVVACALLTFGGSVAFALARLSREWRPHAEPEGGRTGALRGAGVRTLILALFLFAVGVGAIEIAVAAFAEGEGARGAVGPVLALWGVGSMIGGFVTARLRAPADPPRRLTLLLLVLAVASAPLAAAGNLWVLGGLMVISGLAIAPALAVAFGLLSDVAPRGSATEAQTLIATGFGGGIALGSALGGWAVESASTTTAFVLAAVALAAAAAAVAARLHVLRTDAAPGEDAAGLRPEAATA